MNRVDWPHVLRSIGLQLDPKRPVAALAEALNAEGFEVSRDTVRNWTGGRKGRLTDPDVVLWASRQAIRRGIKLRPPLSAMTAQELQDEVNQRTSKVLQGIVRRNPPPVGGRRGVAVAQSVERGDVAPVVVGSSPTRHPPLPADAAENAAIAAEFAAREVAPAPSDDDVGDVM